MTNGDGRASADRPSAICFSSFRLDPRAGQLTRAGKAIPLRPKTWSVLLYLAERPGVLVSKDQLLDAVWPQVAVTPDTLTKSIGELRVALDDDSKTPRCIETVHRRGFRFIAEIASGSGASLPGLKEPPTHTGDQDSDTGCFVGRAVELRRLEALLGHARAGERKMVFVSGPAGVGKSALVEAFLDSPAVRGASGLWVGRGSCVEQHGPREAYMPVLEALERLARRPDAHRLTELLRRTAPTWLAQMPWLIGDDAKALQQSLHAAHRERMLRELGALTETLTTDVTLVLVLEDLHWSDPSTVDLLSMLGQRREPARLLVIGTYRPAEAAVQEHVLLQTVRALYLHQQCVELPVHELSQEDLQSYLERRFPGTQLLAALAHVLHHHTDGNPLFMVAVVEHMLSRGLILDTAPGWALSVAPEQLELGIPDDVRRMIVTQLEILSPADRTLLEVASVGGVRFAVQGIAAALEGDVEIAEMRCETLARAHRFLRVAGHTEWPDGSVARRYTFIHELYRQAVYAEIPDHQRQRLHQRIGEALEIAHGAQATDVAAELAIHFEQSRDHARAVQYLGAAAERARQRFANREALNYLESALAVATHLPDADARGNRELALRVALMPVLSDLHGFASEPVRENCERTEELCAAVGSPAQRFQILYALCHLHSVRADPNAAPAMEAKLDKLARQLRIPEPRLLVDSIRLRNAVHAGRFIAACRLAEKRLPISREAVAAQALAAYGADAVSAATWHYGLALWFLGHTERGRTTVQAALAGARERGEPFTLTAALFFASLIALLSQRTEEARRLAEESLSVSTEHGFVFWEAMAAALKGRALIAAGHVREGAAEIERARIAHESTGARLFSTYILAFQAEAHLHAGTFAAGLAAVDEALALAQSTLDRSFWSELWRLKGELLLSVDSRQLRVDSRESKADGARHARPRALDRRRSTHSRDEAECCLLRALDLARAAQAKSLELRAATSLARAWQARGRTADAAAVLAGICSWFGSTAAGADLIEARALLHQLRSVGTRPLEASARTAAPRRRECR